MTRLISTLDQFNRFSDPIGAPGGTFLGNPIGCDANGDGTISAGDITCVVLIIFNGPGACGASGLAKSVELTGMTSPHLSPLPVLGAEMLALSLSGTMQGLS